LLRWRDGFDRIDLGPLRQLLTDRIFKNSRDTAALMIYRRSSSSRPAAEGLRLQAEALAENRLYRRSSATALAMPSGFSPSWRPVIHGKMRRWSSWLEGSNVTLDLLYIVPGKGRPPSFRSTTLRSSRSANRTTIAGARDVAALIHSWPRPC